MSELWQRFQDGGWEMWLILFFLCLGIGVGIERTIFLYKCSINRDVFLATMQKCILAGDISRAIKLCSAANAPLSRIVKAGLMKINRNDAEVQAAMDEAALRELPQIEKNTPYLALIANLGMLCGLFGTVMGLINSFEAVGGASAADKATLLAAGISQAMNCTAFGLISAIVALIFFAGLNGKTQGLLDDINSATVQVMNLVVNNRSKVNLEG